MNHTDSHSAYHSAYRSAPAPTVGAALRRLMTTLFRWLSAVDCTTTAPVHYVSIADATRRTDARYDRP